MDKKKTLKQLKISLEKNNLPIIQQIKPIRNRPRQLLYRPNGQDL